MTTPTEHAAEAMWEAIDDKGINGRLTREDCTYLAEALAAAGLIATETQWGVRYPSGGEFQTRSLEAAQAEVANAAEDGVLAVLLVRTLTPWKDADA